MWQYTAIDMAMYGHIYMYIYIYIYERVTDKTCKLFKVLEIHYVPIRAPAKIYSFFEKSSRDKLKKCTFQAHPRPIHAKQKMNY